MIDFLLLIICAMLWIQGFNCLFSEDHIFEKLGDWLESNLPIWINKPLWACPMCQSSVHGTIAYFVFATTGVYIWPIFCICLCGLNFIISKFTNRKREIKLTDDPDF